MPLLVRSDVRYSSCDTVTSDATVRSCCTVIEPAGAALRVTRSKPEITTGLPVASLMSKIIDVPSSELAVVTVTVPTPLVDWAALRMASAASAMTPAIVPPVAARMPAAEESTRTVWPFTLNWKILPSSSCRDAVESGVVTRRPPCEMASALFGSVTTSVSSERSSSADSSGLK